MITPYMKHAIKRFEDAVKDKAWIGAAHPGDHRSIEERYQETKRSLEEAIERHGTKQFTRGKEDAYSRVGNSPGDGDMGG